MLRALSTITPSPADEHDPALTTREAAALLGISVSTAQKWIEGGAVESWKTPGGHRRMRRKAVLRLLEERTAMASAAPDTATHELRPLSSPTYAVAPSEAARLRAVGRTGLLDTDAEPTFDRITRLAAIMAGTPFSAISLLTATRQWFKSRQGIEACETSRDVAFCNQVVVTEQLVVVEDARDDPRFRDNPAVTGEPYVRFYAGCPLHAPDGLVVGTLCVFDRTPRRLDSTQLECLRALAEIAEDEIRLYMVERGRR
ncbi:DNA binding domain-containing protein, excisionase family [Luteibacter sp. UNCMF331Sha3.1]|nr:DNA binding domain-containing protein, excisionase family [Luteibacter sp. UNCMF331Sha3.1]